MKKNKPYFIQNFKFNFRFEKKYFKFIKVLRNLK